MSTYEALADLYERMNQRMKTALVGTDNAIKIADLVLDLADRGLLDMAGTHYQRMASGRRRLAIACRLAADSIRDKDAVLSDLERERVLLDVAANLGKKDAVLFLEAKISKMLDKAQSELGETYEALELVERGIVDLAPPRMVAG